MKSAILRAAVLAMAPSLMLAALVAVPAEAANNSSIQVYRCSNSDCSSKTAVQSGPVSGLLQIQVKATTTGLIPPTLKSIEVDVRPASSSTAVCLYYNGSAKSGTTYYPTWNTASLPSAAPSGCGNSSLYGTLTRNESVVISVRSVDNSSSNNTSTASISSLSLNNPPTPPAWAASPSVSGAAQRAPVVTLKWGASPEPDIQEYRFFRTDPSGTTKQYPVSASNPSAQGCSFNGTTYTCYDTDFASTGFGGTYSYAIAAYRSSPSSVDHCYYPNQQTSCIGAQSSDVQHVTITEPAPPSPTPTNTGSAGGGGGTGGGLPAGGGGGSPGNVPSGVPSISSRDSTQSTPPTSVLGQQIAPGDCFTCGTYQKTLPYGQLPGGNGSTPGSVVPGNRQLPVLAAGSGLGSGSGGPDPRQLWVSIAAGLVLLLTAGHVARVLRTTAR